MLFFGIEELGVQIEEPFSILPLEDFVAAIELAGMLAARARRLGPNQPCASLLPIMTGHVRNGYGYGQIPERWT